MSSEIQAFSNPAFGRVRTVVIDDNPWFVGKDVAEALGYSNPQKAIRDRVDDEDKGVNEMFTPGGTQQVTIINESGLYSLVLSSKLPTAKEFKRWVTSEVLPSIRKHGAYMTESTLQAAKEDPDMIYNLAKALLDERDKVTELKPKAEYAERCLLAANGVNITSIAKEYGMSGAKLNQILHGLGIQYQNGKQWVLYAKHQDKGYTVTKTTPIQHSDGHMDVVLQTMWTQKGKKFIDDSLRKVGIIK